MKKLDIHAYRAALENSAYYVILQTGLLEIAGDDRSSFLQRQTTNNLADLSPDHALLTVLTSPTARILDVFYLIEEPQAVNVLTLPGRREWSASYLKSRIFFMDKVTLTDKSREFFQLDLIGPGANHVLASLGHSGIQDIDRVESLLVESGWVKVWMLQPRFGFGYRILAPAELEHDLTKSLISAGAPGITESEYQVLRVEAGVPAFESELTEEYTPLEVGLSAAVSDRKGCYTGQEVLSRQATYDKITHRLIGMRLDGQAENGSSLATESGVPAGVLTSCVKSPRFGWIGLAVIRRPADMEGTRLRVGNQSTSERSGEVVRLPFGA